MPWSRRMIPSHAAGVALVLLAVLALGLLVVAIGYGLNVSKLRRVCIGVALLNFALLMVLV